MDTSEPRTLLIGGGHAHLAVLADWIKNGLPSSDAAILTPSPHLRYSGTVPGWIAGEYARDEGLVDVAGLAKAAGAQLILDRCVSLDANTRTVLTQNNGVQKFEIASIDTGGVGRAGSVLGDDPRVIDVRPIDGFVDEVARRLASKAVQNIAVIGGGAGGVELAFGLRNRTGASRLTVIEGAGGLLPSFGSSARRLVKAELTAQGITTLFGDARFVDDVLFAGKQPLEHVELIIAALGTAAPDWPHLSGLATNNAGFIAVDRYQRSLSHPHIFAVGDVAARQDREVPRSGVHAVHAGPIVAANIRAAAQGNCPSKSYRPRPASLYLLSTGNGAAVATYGPIASKGRWAGKLKRWIDKRWLASYARLSGKM